MCYTYVCLYVCTELSRKRVEDFAEVVLEDRVIKCYSKLSIYSHSGNWWKATNLGQENTKKLGTRPVLIKLS